MMRTLAILAALSLTATALTGCFKYKRPAAVASSAPTAGAFPHEIFDRAIADRVDDDGRIDYKAIQTDRAALDEYLGYIALTSPAKNPELFPTREARLAYYINAYNALAIRGVIDRPGLTSVDDIKVEYFYYTRYNIGGTKLDLYRLENKIVRPEFKDPRVHFALNCQSGGCPIFPPTAFHPNQLDTMLDEQTSKFVHHPEKVRQKEDGSWEVSQIFEWYADDFKDAGGVAAFIHKYREEVPADAPLTYIPYDWALIAQTGKGP